MSTKLKLYIDSDEIFDVFNFLDQKNINIDYNKKKLFLELIKEKNFDMIEFFLDRDSKPEEFINYCTEENADVLNFLIEKNTTITGDPVNILVNLIDNKMFGSAKLLLESYHHNTNKLINSNSGKALQTAIKKGSKEMVQLLFIYGAKIKKCQQDPIIDALIYNCPDIIPILLENGSNIESVMPEHLEICLNQGHRVCISFIITNLIDGKLKHFAIMDLTNCLLAAVRKNNIQVLCELFNCNNNINNKTYKKLKAIAKNNLILHYLEIFAKQSKKGKLSKKETSNSDSLIVKNKSGVHFKTF